MITRMKKDMHRAADDLDFEKAATFRELVRMSYEAASPGDVVLLAPAATSWDMFDNFEQRGRTFKREVRSLARKVKGR